jgi:hypothetical protein
MAVQLDPIKPKLKARGSELLKLNCDDLLTFFAFKFILRHYTEATHAAVVRNLQKHAASAQRGGGQHTLVHGPPGRDWQIMLAMSRMSFNYHI